MTLRKRLLAIVLISVCMGGLLSVALAQAPAAPKATTTAAASAPAEPEGATWGGQKMTLLFLWNVGGWCMWPLGATNVAAVAFTIVGYLVIREKKMLAPEVVPNLQDSLGKLNIEEAMRTCAQTPSMMTNVLHAGLQRITDGFLDAASMEKAMEESSVEETQEGLRLIGYISISAQIAPMLGLLGTVSGMIKAFEKIGRGAMGKPELLANDIGEALITTAYGLIIGIPAMCFYFYLKSRYTANITKMGRVLGNMSHHLVTASRRAESGQLPQAPAEPAAQPAGN
jgi:biopolymer transport protein ExbB